ncbi:helix-turn-helix domain-containing protein [Paraburkholderia sp. 22B1P]|uniref:AraC family transcriptional regulator n=1 Tax=Paraburkholderia sp. 22B1P TaxID=3080498 RepID=UPI00309181AF|nr:AraC family transcriptional regulator [Paraburkholderia sp. 22B1P]
MTELDIFEATCPPEFDGNAQCGPTTAWIYRRRSTRHVLETAYWNGPSAPDGRSHFHDEAQLVFVISGRREFIVRSRSCVVNAGQCLLIPAGHLHRSIPRDKAPTQCLNLYVSEAQVSSLCSSLRVSPVVDVKDREISDVVRKSLLAMSDLPAQFHDVSDLAAAFGYSREGFSRKFARETGVGPAEYSLLLRLNRARALLRNGTPSALTALECGFADQSHMGRHFQRIFGTSPVQYARA